MKVPFALATLLVARAIPRVAQTLALLAVVGAHQPAAAQQPPTYRSSVDVVEVDVVVQNKRGEFVSDLALEDFELFEEGKLQRVQHLNLYLLEDQRKPATREGSAIAITATAAAPRVFVVVFDEGHMSPAGFKRAQETASALFGDHLRNGDLGGVVVNGVMTNDRLTDDRGELLKAVRDAKPSLVKTSQHVEERQWPRLSEVEAVRIVLNGDSIVLEDVARRACTEDPDQCRGLDGAVEEYVQSKALQMAEEARAQSTRTLQVLTQLMNGLGTIAGRKSVLLMSEGFMSDEIWPLVQQAQELAARANARIYTLDARGLDRSGNASGNQTGLGQLLQQMDSGDTLNTLAADTGGFVVRNVSVFGSALTQIAADAGNYYVLGYRPAALDGKLHKITVKVKRPGLAVRARKGYIAAPSPSISITTPISARPIEPAAVEAGTAPEAADTHPSAADTSELGARPDAASHIAALERNTPANAAATAGWEAYSRGDLESARSSLSAAAADPSAHAWVHYALGHAQYALKDYAKAISAWERVVATAPEFEPVYFDLADAYLQEKYFDRAVRVLRQGAGRWPLDGEIFKALGVVQAWGGEVDDAVESFEKAAALSPSDAAAHFNLGKALELRYYGSRRYDEQLQAWTANEEDRKKAAASYLHCLALGGPFAVEAQEGLSRLEWMTK